MQPINNEYHPLNNDFNNNYNTANGVQNDPLINAVPPPVQDINAVPPPVQTPQPLYQVQQPLYQPQPQVVYQPVIAQPLYSQNVLVTQPQPVVQANIIVNQQQPLIPQSTFLVSPVHMVCPFCNTQITTRVVTHFNFAALCLFCFISYFYFIIQCIRGKDCCCSDATHYCPNCGHEVGRYNCF